MADYSSNIYQNHCVPSGNNNIVIQCEDCLDETTFQPIQNACETKKSHGISESLIAEISTQMFYVPAYTSSSVPAPALRRNRFTGNNWSDNQIEPFFDIQRQVTPKSNVVGYFRFDNANARSQTISQVVAQQILGPEYVESGAVYNMSWFNFELFFDTVGERDNTFKVEASLCGQHETAGGSSLYQTIAWEGSVGSGVDENNASGSRATLSIIVARQVMINEGTAYGSLTRVLQGDGDWNTLWTGPYFTGPLATNIIDPVDDGRSRPVMLFGRTDQVWKIRVSSLAHDGDTTTGNYWKFKMYLLDANGNRK